MENKTCTKCSQTKPLDEFRRDVSTKSGYKQPCQECNKKQSVIWQKEKYQKSPEYKLKRIINSAKQTPKRRKDLRQQILSVYGGKCVCCGETQPAFLAVDHIFNDGALHRRELQMKSGSEFYIWLKKNDFPKDRFQLLCHNCNFAKYLCGVCPHQQ